jgi:methyl-accepting chemotaxis protein
LVIGGRVVDQVTANLEETLSLLSRSLDNVESSLVQAQTTLNDINRGLDTVSNTAVNFAQLIQATKPLLDQVSQTVGGNVAEGIDAVRTVVSDLAQAAKNVDDALRLVNNVGGLLGIELDLGKPLEKPVSEIGVVLDTLASDVEGLKTDFDDTAAKVDRISQDTQMIGEDIAAINESLAGFGPIIDEYIDIVKELRERVDRTQADVGRQTAGFKLAISVFMIWIGLTNITPLYLGWELVTGRRNRSYTDTDSAAPGDDAVS